MTLLAEVGDAAADVLVRAAAQRRIATVRRVNAVAEAQVVWLGDPAGVVEVSDRIVYRVPIDADCSSGGQLLSSFHDAAIFASAEIADQGDPEWT